MTMPTGTIVITMARMIGMMIGFRIFELNDMKIGMTLAVTIVICEGNGKGYCDHNL